MVRWQADGGTFANLPARHLVMQAYYANFIRWAFTRFYREFAWTYDGVAAAVSGGQWSTWALAALPFLEGRVLELGCGTGNVQRALAAQPEHAAIGIDLSRQMLGRARRKLAAIGALAPLAQASAGALPFADSSFDTLVATFPSEYIVAPTTRSEARRVLRPGGQVVILLGAQFRASDTYRQAIDLLYRLTLQRPVLAAEEPTAAHSLVGARYAEAGFTVRELLITCRNADIHVIIAQVA